MNSPKLDALNARAAECDKHHHFYHYKSSWQHLSFADALLKEGKHEDALKHYKASLFQDHLNAHAKAGLAGESRADIPAYDMHVKSGALEALELFEASLGWEKDASAALCQQGHFEEALKISSSRHDRYHRHASASHYERGKYFMEKGEPDLAIADFSKALDLYGKNRDALMARADAYEKKGAEKLAQEDRLLLSSVIPA